MGLSTLAVLVFGAATWVAWRIGALRPVPALCAVLLGFFLADSGAAPAIHDAVAAVFAWIATWNV
jgi:hypothetical protein